MSKDRYCRECAERENRLLEWKSNHCLYDHATSARCEVCGKCNGFTVKMEKRDEVLKS